MEMFIVYKREKRFKLVELLRFKNLPNFEIDRSLELLIATTCYKGVEDELGTVVCLGDQGLYSSQEPGDFEKIVKKINEKSYLLGVNKKGRWYFEFY